MVDVEALGWERDDPVARCTKGSRDVVLVVQRIRHQHGTDRVAAGRIVGREQLTARLEHIGTRNTREDCHIVVRLLQGRGQLRRIGVQRGHREAIECFGVIAVECTDADVDDRRGAEQATGRSNQTSRGVTWGAAASRRYCRVRRARRHVRDIHFESATGDHVAHRDDLEVTFAGTIDRLRTIVSRLTQRGQRTVVTVRRKRCLDSGRNAVEAAVIMGNELRASGGVANRGDGTRPYVVHRQVHVEVENFAAVVAFKKANLDRLAVNRVGVHHGELGVLALVDRVVRVDKNLAETVRIKVNGTRQAREASDAGDSGDDGCRQVISLHRNTPKFEHRAFCFTADLASITSMPEWAGQGQTTALPC